MIQIAKLFSERGTDLHQQNFEFLNFPFHQNFAISFSKVLSTLVSLKGSLLKKKKKKKAAYCCPYLPFLDIVRLSIFIAYYIFPFLLYLMFSSFLWGFWCFSYSFYNCFISYENESLTYKRTTWLLSIQSAIIIIHHLSDMFGKYWKKKLNKL